MKNIFEIMKEYGVEIPEEQRKNFEKAVLANYKTSADYEKQKKKLEKANSIIANNEKALRNQGETQFLELEYQESASKLDLDIQLRVMPGVVSTMKVGVK